MSISRKTGVMLSSAAAALVIAAPGTAHAESIYGSARIERLASGAGANFYASWSSHSQQEADDMAARQCGSKPGGGPACDLFFQWADGCAAIATRDGKYYWAVGANSGEAGQAAKDAANVGAPASGSAIFWPAALVAPPFCTPNAG